MYFLTTDRWLIDLLNLLLIISFPTYLIIIGAIIWEYRASVREKKMIKVESTANMVILTSKKKNHSV